MKTVTRWKFLRTGYKSDSGNLKWKLGKWNRVKGELDMCQNGLHCSKTALQAFFYVQGEILAEVECRGEHLADEDKECWREMRVVKAYRWTKKDSVRLAVYVAELCLKHFEKEYPNDKRPREAIEAAMRYLETGSKKGLAEAIEAAAKAAWEADWEADWAADWIGEGKKITKKISRYFDKQVKTLRVLKEATK